MFLFKWLAIAGVAGALLVAIGVGYLYFKIWPTLPDVQQLREVQLQVPLRIYTAEGDLIAEYGEKRREPVMISEVPDSLKYAIIGAEDARFYKHPGVDWQGLARAGLHLLRTGRKGPGGSTITMQVARNFFLTNEVTYSRKINEIFLALKIEQELDKDQILELYINKIYLGNRSYGFAAASRVYYGKRISDLDLAESAMLAGLPKAPSRYNPIVNPERALLRRNYVLRRLKDIGFIDAAAMKSAQAQPVTARLHYARPETEAHYVGEMVRARIQELFGDKWATAGYSVYTTIESAAQETANKALRRGLYDYERRHGYTGPVTVIEAELLENPETLLEALDELPTPADLMPAAVVSVEPESLSLVSASGARTDFTLEQLAWARERISVDQLGEEITDLTSVFAPGHVVYVSENDEGELRIVQEPGVEAAFVALDPKTGGILALVGGYDYYRSKFNRVVQARRQPGSSFKPFVYSAALDAGETAASIYNDAPVVFHDNALEDEWRPQNYSGRFYGPTRLREALVRSLNLVSVRVLREIGIRYTVEYATRFGFERKNMQEDLSLALGSANVTPLEMARGFAVFANGGYRVEPIYIDRVMAPNGKVLYQAPEVVLCDDCDPAMESPLVDEVSEEDNMTGAENAEPDVAGALPADAAAGADYSEGEDADSSVNLAAARELERVTLDTVDAPRVIDARNAFLMSSFMRDVILRGTARKAGKALGRTDLAGKTGTTNNYLDAWFVGFGPDTVAAAWIGSDGLEPLGRAESGGTAALPIWTRYMATMLDGVPEQELVEPPGMLRQRVDRRTGEARSGEGTVLEWFYEENPPEADETAELANGGTDGSGKADGTGDAGNGADADSVDGADDATSSGSKNGRGTTVPRTREQRVRDVEQLF